jgi:MAF protein
MRIVLASSSPYRRELMGRLGLEFTAFAPGIDETPRAAESADALVARLSEAKAHVAAMHYPDALVIGSDQAAVVGSLILEKPGSAAAAQSQLQSLCGKSVTFYTGLCVFNARTASTRVAVETAHVTYRDLSAAAIARYIARDQPYDCVGAFKSEGYGVVVCSAMSSDDPTALVGLPLIRLVAMLGAEGIDIP